MPPLYGYPTSHGSTRAAVFSHAGPASYTPLVPQSPPAVPVDDGDVVEAIEAGMTRLDYVSGGVTDDGLYQVLAVPVTNSDVRPGAASTTWRLLWIDLATGNQVASAVDLSGSVVRLFALGPMM
jgi:hypothetical protein